jgi:hypothetical protein
MKCPKCKAKIGASKEHICIELGNAVGILCYMCGYWKQEIPRSRKGTRKGLRLANP